MYICQLSFNLMSVKMNELLFFFFLTQKNQKKTFFFFPISKTWVNCYFILKNKIKIKRKKIFS